MKVQETNINEADRLLNGVIDMFNYNLSKTEQNAVFKTLCTDNEKYTVQEGLMNVGIFMSITRELPAEQLAQLVDSLTVWNKTGQRELLNINCLDKLFDKLTAQANDLLACLVEVYNNLKNSGKIPAKPAPRTTDKGVYLNAACHATAEAVDYISKAFELLKE